MSRQMAVHFRKNMATSVRLVPSQDAGKTSPLAAQQPVANLPQTAFLCLVSIFVMLLVGCNGDPSSSTPLAASPHGSSNAAEDFIQTTAVRKDDASSSAPDVKLGNKSTQSGIEAIYADTDGDQVPEHIAVCDRTKVCINYTLSNSTNRYGETSWAGVYLAAVVDTDGEQGEEIVVRVTNHDGQLVCVCVVHDRTGTVESYSDPFWYSANIVSIADTDGESGQDIVFIARDQQGAFNCICVIHDRQRSYKSYADPSWTTTRIEWLEDTDAQPGKEIIVEVRGLRDDLRCFCVIHDRAGSVTSYFTSAWKGGTIYKVAETDGKPGEDIIISYVDEPGGGVSVIHDISQDINMYPFSGDRPIIQRLVNFDKSKGSDLCIQLGQQKGYVIIKDKAQESIPVETCSVRLL